MQINWFVGEGMVLYTSVRRRVSVGQGPCLQFPAFEIVWLVPLLAVFVFSPSLLGDSDRASNQLRLKFALKPSPFRLVDKHPNF